MIIYCLFPLDGFEARPFVCGTQGRSMRSPAKPKETLSRVLPLRWSFGTKGHFKNPAHTKHGELVEYLESGRRPRCTKDPIITLVATPPQRKSKGKVFKVGHDCSSPSSSSLSCTDRLGLDTCYSPKIPAGQRRSISHCNNNNYVKARDYGSLRQRSLKRVGQDQDMTLDLQLQKGAILDSHFSHSAPASRDSTLTKTKSGLSFRAQKDLLQMVLKSEDRKAQRGHEGYSQESLFSFFTPNFMKTDNLGSPVKRQDRLMNVDRHLGKLASINQAKLSLSNGTLPTVALEERKAIVVQSCNPHNSKAQPMNSQAPSLDPVDIKRAHSSINIDTKLDGTFHRCGSPRRNGKVPAAHPIQLSEKPSYTTLQFTVYSTTSLGRTQTCK